MTFVGKMLVVVQLVLSICFMAFAGAVVAVQQNWKAETESLTIDLDSSRKAVNNLQATMESVKQTAAKDVQDAENARDDAIAARNQVVNAGQIAADNLKRKTDELESQQAVNVTLAAEVEARRSEAKAQRDVNEELHKKLDGLSDDLRGLKDEIFSEKRTNETIIARYNKVLVDFANARNYIQLNGLEVPTDFSEFAGATPPPPNVHGVVMDARKSTKQRGVEYVEISIGSDDGLLEGHSLYVFRSAAANKGKAKFLGRIEIVLLTPDRAVGTVVGKAKNGVIQKGDHVTTRL